jgi:enoyl-CoA hydratase/carnithine racemase
MGKEKHMNAIPTQSLVTTDITNNIGRVMFSNLPVNPLSHDVCAGVIDAIDECEKANVRVVVLGANRKSKIWSAVHDIKEIPHYSCPAVRAAFCLSLECPAEIEQWREESKKTSPFENPPLRTRRHPTSAQDSGQVRQ